MTDDFQILESRPAERGRGSGKSALYEALALTVINGGSVRIPINGADAGKLYVRIAAGLRSRGLGIRHTREGDALICWAVRKGAAS